MSNEVNVNMEIERLRDDPEVMAAVKRLTNLKTVIRWAPVAVFLVAGELWGLKAEVYVLATWYVARYAQYRHEQLMRAGARMVGEKIKIKEGE